MKKIAGILILTLIAACSTPEHKENWKKAAVVGAVALALVAIAKGGGGGGGQNYGAATGDTGWAWDGFYSNGAYRWACRGVQTGRFAEDWHCAGQIQNDNHWPG